METISVNFPSFGFSEYALLAILQAILLTISCIELSGINANRSKYKETETKDMQKATAIVFIGILVTLAGGLGAQFVQRGFWDTLLIFIPFPFVVSWATYYRRGSQFVDFSSLQVEVDKQYSLIIENCLRESNSGNGLRFEQLYVDCLKRLQKPDTWSGALNLSLGSQPRLFSALGFSDLLETFTFSELKCRELLNLLIDKKGIVKDSEDNYLHADVRRTLGP